MSWTVLPVSADQVRTYLDISTTTGQFSDAQIGSNIRASASFLQRTTGRLFERDSGTKLFTTEGRSYVAIPDVRSVTSVTLQSSALTADSSYWLIPDVRNSGIYVGVQFRAFGASSYLSNPEWFDRNLDRTWAQGRSSLPNDLAIASTEWGWSPYPDEFLHATLVLAGFYTRRPASVLADAAVTPEGTELRYSQLPVEVRTFIGDWTLGSQMVVI